MWLWLLEHDLVTPEYDFSEFEVDPDKFASPQSKAEIFEYYV